MNVRRYSVLLLCLVFLPQIATAASDVVISQVYGGGGNAGATYKNDFIELFNRGTSSVSLAGWSVQYASSAGTTWQVTALSGSIAPGQYYLVQEAVGAGGTVNLPTPDATGTIMMSATAGKVALVASTTALSGSCPVAVDIVGFGGANCFEGAGPTATLSNTTAALRKSDGAVDTDSNSADFVVGAPTPRNSGSISNLPPVISAPADPIATIAQGSGPITVNLTGSDDDNLYNWSATAGAGVDSVTVTGGQGTSNVTYSVAVNPGFAGPASFTASLSDGVNPADTQAVNISVTPTIPNDPPTITPFANPVATVAQDAAPFTVEVSGLDDDDQYSWSATAVTGISSVSVSAGQGTANVTYSVTLQPGFSGTAEFTASLSDGVNPNVTHAVTITVTPAPPPPVDHLVISQIYGGGGNSGATYRNDYVELFNPTSETILVSGWSVQYASATGTSWQVQPLGGVVQPGEYYLVALASGGAAGALLPQANINGSINMSGTAGKVALVNSGDALSGCPVGDPTLVDLVGYGTTANCREGSTNAPPPSNTTALFRKNGGLLDTNVNGSDFVTGVPNPRRTATVGEIGPYVLSVDPRNATTSAPRDLNITVTFTEPVAVSGAWFNISCASTGLHNDATVAAAGNMWIIVPNVTFLPGEQCTATVYKNFVHDIDLDDSEPNTDTLHADYSWTFSIATGAAPSYTADVHLTMGNPSGAVADIGVPNNYLMVKPELALSYNRDRGTPNWVSWHLADEWVGSLARVDTFRADPAVPADWYRVLATDYFQSGFDRGHLTPNADRDPETSIPINQATFLMTNMMPQAPDNNQGPWANMENYLRTLLPANELYIVAGGSGVGGTGSSGFATTIAGGHVTVPESTWKVVLVLPKASGDDVQRVTPAARTIAVIMPNVQGIRNNNWENYIVSVDAVEALSGYDFFANVADPVEYSIEVGVNGANPPVATDQSVSVTEDVAAAFTLQSMSANSNPLTYTILSGPSHGTLSGTGASQTYTPAPDFFGTDTFTFKVSDGSLHSQTATVTLNVLPVNDPPVVLMTAPVTSTEGADVTATATVTDVDSSSFTYVWTATKNGSPFASATSTTFTFTPDDDGSYVVSLTVNDGSGGSDTEQASVAVSNVAPAIGSIAGPSAALTVGSSASISFGYTDAGTADTHVATFTWDDGSTSPVICAAGSCTATHTYASTGVYGVAIQLLDDDGGSAGGLFEFVIVVDPAGPFANGSGWVKTTAEGKASFAFSSKYHETQGVPSGQAELSTSAFEFNSATYSSIVVAGSKVQIRGTGTINGAGSYGFILTATDGDVAGGDRTDRFRIKIWETSTGSVLYDNAAGASDDIDAAAPQSLGGGNISIQQSGSRR